MKFGKLLATAFLAGTAVIGTSGMAFASTTGTPVAPSIVHPTGQPTGGSGGYGGGDNGNGHGNGHGDGHGNGGGDNHGNGGGDNRGGNGYGDGHGNGRGNGGGNNCDPRGHQNDSQGNWGQNNCGQTDGCHIVRGLLPWGGQCGNQCDHSRELTVFTQGHQGGQWDNQGGPWQCQGDPGHGNGHGDHGRGHRTHCTSQLLFFNFFHGSHVLTETQGPGLHVGEVATYQGMPYTVTSTGSNGHFTVSDWNHSLVTNNGPSIWHGQAHVLSCS